jgi:membrane-bound inhibitor of C-type lysozyme
MRIIGICILAAIVCIGFTACEQPEGKKFTYKCGDGTYLEITIPEDGDTASLRYDGRNHTLKHVPSASGAKYEGEKYVFWSKGNTAFLKIDGEVVHDGCVLVE